MVKTWKQNIPEYEFSLTHFFPYKDKIYQSVFIRENTSQREPAFWHILRSEVLLNTGNT